MVNTMFEPVAVEKEEELLWIKIEEEDELFLLKTEPEVCDKNPSGCDGILQNEVNQDSHRPMKKRESSGSEELDQRKRRKMNSMHCNKKKDGSTTEIDTKSQKSLPENPYLEVSGNERLLASRSVKETAVDSTDSAPKSSQSSNILTEEIFKRIDELSTTFLKHHSILLNKLIAMEKKIEKLEQKRVQTDNSMVPSGLDSTNHLKLPLKTIGDFDELSERIKDTTAANELILALCSYLTTTFKSSVGLMMPALFGNELGEHVGLTNRFKTRCLKEKGEPSRLLKCLRAVIRSRFTVSYPDIDSAIGSWLRHYKDRITTGRKRN